MKKTRIFYSNNGVLEDWTTDIGNYSSGDKTFSFVPAEDYFYIANNAPFNHFYTKLGGTVNASDAVMALEYWTGTEWAEVIEIIDETNGLKNSGFVTWVPDREKSWQRAHTNYSSQVITGLSTLNIYDMYWVRIKFTGILDPSIIMSWIGQKFCDDLDIASEYPDLVRTNVKTAFAAGKTNYEEQVVRASELLVQDLLKTKCDLE